MPVRTTPFMRSSCLLLSIGLLASVSACSAGPEPSAGDDQLRAAAEENFYNLGGIPVFEHHDFDSPVFGDPIVCCDIPGADPMRLEASACNEYAGSVLMSAAQCANECEAIYGLCPGLEYPDCTQQQSCGNVWVAGDSNCDGMIDSCLVCPEGTVPSDLDNDGCFEICACHDDPLGPEIDFDVCCELGDGSEPIMRDAFICYSMAGMSVPYAMCGGGGGESESESGYTTLL